MILIKPDNKQEPTLAPGLNTSDNIEEEFYEGVAKAADFVNERLEDVIAPTALNNTVDEYADGDTEKP